MTTQRTWGRAIVTGAAAGIGEAFARRLGRRGDLAGAGRPRSAASAADRRRLAAAHPVEVEVLAADLADADGAARVAERIAGEPSIDLLLNNAGVGSKGTFAELTLDRELRQIDLVAGVVTGPAPDALRAWIEMQHDAGGDSVFLANPDPWRRGAVLDLNKDKEQ